MSDKKIKADLQLADSFSTTPKKVTEFTHLWTIENFLHHPKDKIIQSPPFSAAPNDSVRWQLLLHPDGSKKEGEGSIAIYLNLASCDAIEASAHFTISVLNGDYELKATKTLPDAHVYTLTSGDWGWEKFIKREAVLSNSTFPDHKLIVRCKISYASEVGQVVPSVSSFFPPATPEYNPSANFHELLESGMLSDVIFDVNGKEFRAHKSILAARSPTFKTLFERNSEGTQPKRLKIRDADDRTFSELLHLIYTGKTNESYRRIQNLLSMISAQSEAISTSDPVDVEGEEDTEVLARTQSQETQGKPPSRLKRTIPAEDSNASAVLVLQSIYALIASTGALELGASRANGDARNTACKIHPGIGLTPSAALCGISAIISATKPRFQGEESSTPKLPEEKLIKTMKITDEPISKITGLTLSSESNEYLQDDQLLSSSICVKERNESQVPVLGVEKLGGGGNAFFRWWYDFKAKVHDRQDLCMNQKSVYLMKVLGGESKECINSMPSDELTYFSTLDSLFLRYGNIEALPPGMFALLIARQQSRLAVPLCIVGNKMLMEQIENGHPDSHGPKSSEAVKHEVGQKDSNELEEEGVLPSSKNECQCQALSRKNDDASMHREKPCNCAAAVELQLEELESLFAETQTPDSSTQKHLAKKIGLTEAAIQMWFRLRPVDWNKALHPHWQLDDVDALRDCSVQTTTIDSDGGDFDVMKTDPLPKPSTSSASSSSGSDFLFV